jgi:hypothetical protein
MPDANAGHDVLVAHVKTGGHVCVVRADEVGRALISLHGTPKHGLQVQVDVEYVLMSAMLFADMENFDRNNLQH